MMYVGDHNAPHFHAKYGEHEALFDIKTLGMTKGYMPSKARALIVEWASERSEELMYNWKLCENFEQPQIIKPL